MFINSSHFLKKNNNIQSKLAGNIGHPILNLKFLHNVIYIIEASSFQLEYSKFIKPHCAAILNISKDHLDWHGSIKQYTNSKIKIFNNQVKNDVAFLNDLKLKKLFLSKDDFHAKLKFIKKILLTCATLKMNILD